MINHRLVVDALGKDTLEDYDGQCGELADSILHAATRAGIKKQAILWIEAVDAGAGGLLAPRDHGAYWRHHMVAVIDGKVIDPWFNGPEMYPKRYVKTMFPGQVVTFSMVEEDDG